MNKLLLCQIVVVLGLAFGSTVVAQDTFSLYMENDSRYFKPNGRTDRHYTHGTKLVYTFQPDWQWLDVFGGAAQAEEASRSVGLFLGQNIYTPNYPENPALRKDKERPFAGWLYTGLFVQRRQQDILDHVELNVGVVGPSAQAEPIQECIHEVLNSGKTVGWETQLRDEPAADFVWVRKQRHTEGLLRPTDITDVITDIGFTAGSLHRHAEAGLMLRCGGGLPNDFGPGQLALPHSAAAMDRQSRRAFYLFGRLAGRAVEHDRFLTGLKERPLVGYMQAGLVYRVNDFEIAYAQTFKTEEYKEQGFSDSYGAITLTWLF